MVHTLSIRNFESNVWHWPPPKSPLGSYNAQLLRLWSAGFNDLYTKANGRIRIGVYTLYRLHSSLSPPAPASLFHIVQLEGTAARELQIDKRAWITGRTKKSAGQVRKWMLSGRKIREV
jgi:hypothetical protein